MRERGAAARRGVTRAIVGLLVVVLQTACAGTDPATAPLGAGDTDGYYGTVVDDPPVTLPSARLVDTTGKQVDMRAVSEAAVTLTVFGYTTCPDECPLTVSSIAAAIRGLSPEQREAVQVVVLSADPARDTPAVLRRWLDRFDPAFAGLTGDAETLRRVARELYVPLEVPSPEPSAEAADDVAHGVQIWAFDDEGASLLLWGGSPTPGELRSDLLQLLNQEQPE